MGWREGTDPGFGAADGIPAQRPLVSQRCPHVMPTEPSLGEESFRAAEREEGPREGVKKEKPSPPFHQSALPIFFSPPLASVGCTLV